MRKWQRCILEQCRTCIRTVVRFAVGVMEEFTVEVGLHQRSALSPFLFAMLIDRRG